MAFNPDKIRTGLPGPPLDHRRRRALLDNHLFGHRDADVDSYADIGGGGERGSACDCDDACEQKSV
jgi:hypothetical protein